MEQAVPYELISGILGGGSIAAMIGWYLYYNFQKNIRDIQKVGPLEARVVVLEQQALQHNETRDAVIRLEAKVEGLTEQVRNFMDLIMRKVFANNG
jgi:hypothetical protein